MRRRCGVDYCRAELGYCLEELGQWSGDPWASVCSKCWWLVYCSDLDVLAV